MKSLLIFLLAYSGFAKVTSYQDQKYCKPNLCRSGVKHVACGHSGKFDINCPSDALILKLNTKEKNLFVNSHNSLRNKIAWGKHKGFPTASKMLTLKWDDELASLASLNVMKCKMEHDSCRSTAKFKQAGQNLAHFGRYPRHDSLDADIKKSVDKWFNEIKVAKLDDVKKCCKRNKIVGHFTQIIQDRASRIGCAVARYTQSGMKYTTIACN